MAVGSFRKYDNPGLMLYVGERLVKSGEWSFGPDDPVIISVDEVNHRVEQRKAEWYDLFPWEEYPEICKLLPSEIRNKIPKSRIFKGRFRYYNNPGRMLYIPNDLANGDEWPFGPDDVVKITIENGRVIETKMRWFEMINWEENPGIYKVLSPEAKEEIKQSGILPPYIKSEMKLPYII